MLTTSEMVQKWFESNKTAKFKCINGNLISGIIEVFSNSNGVLCWEGNSELRFEIDVDYSWEKINKWIQSSFEHCIEKWKQGKRIKCIIEEYEYYVKKDQLFFEEYFDSDELITLDFVKKGKWYYEIN